MSRPRLVFVYKADSGLFNVLSDFGHKILSPHTYACRLCALTYGYFIERKQWRSFVEGLGLDCVFLHRDEFRRRYPDNREPLPAVFRLHDEQPIVCLDAERLNGCENLAELQRLIRQHCANTGFERCDVL